MLTYDELSVIQTYSMQTKSDKQRARSSQMMIEIQRKGDINKDTKKK